MSRRDPTVLLRHVLDFAREGVEMTNHRSRADLDTDRMLQLSLLSLIGMAGEAASKVPKEVQEAHPRIAWVDAIGMRHRVIHGYDTVDWDLVWSTVRSDFPVLVAELEHVLANRG